MQGIDLERREKQLAEELDAYVTEHFEELIEKFQKCFSDYCKQIVQMQKQGKKGTIAYIQFSALRTNLLLGKHELRIDAYDETWYLDSVECSACYPVEEIYGYLQKYSNDVMDVWQISQEKNNLADAYRKIFDAGKLYLFYTAELIRMGMKRMNQSESFLSVKKAQCFIVGIGGYMDCFDILYKQDHTIKDSREVKRYLQAGQQRLFSHEIYEKLDLSNGNYEDLEFQYSSFTDCDFSKSNFSKSRFVFCKFQNCVFQDVQMNQIKMFDGDFFGAALENIDFSGAKLKCISFEKAVLKNVDFSNVLLAENMNFKDAEMLNCVLLESR